MIAAIIQARSSSRRLPGKVLLPLAGAPMLARQIERIARASSLDQLLLATSDLPEDDAVAAIATAAGIACYRGSLDDVLDRFYRAASAAKADHVVRLTGDCPLIDPAVIDGCVAFYRDGGFDYATNALEPTWPDGLDVEVMRFAALETAWREASTMLEREHVTPFINRNPDRFRVGHYRGPLDLSAMRWTVDERRDYSLVSGVYERLYPADPRFTTEDVLELLRRDPALARINVGIERNEGLRRSEEASGSMRND